MNYLLDTHILLWAAIDAPKLPSGARQLILDESNRLYFSAASIWEVTIKSGLGREDFNIDPRQFAEALLSNGYIELSVTAHHSAMVYELPDIHKDQFDRILIAQAQSEDLILLTADKMLRQYGRRVEYVE